MAISSKISHSWITSPLQHGTKILYSPFSIGIAWSPVFLRKWTICSAVSLAPIIVSALEWWMMNSFFSIWGVINLYSPWIISIGSTSNGFAQYSEKDQIRVFKHVIAFGLLKAVTSMKTFFVLIEILEWSEFMIGGTERTLSWLSKIKGDTGLSLIKWRYSFSLCVSRSYIIPNPLTFVSWFKGMNSKEVGSLATYLNGPSIESKSWVPIDAYFLSLQNVAWSFYWAEKNALDVFSSNLMFLKIAPTTNGLICFTEESTVMDHLG